MANSDLSRPAINEALRARCTITPKARSRDCDVLVDLHFDKYQPGEIKCNLTCAEKDEPLFRNFIIPNQIEKIEGRLLTGESVSIKPPNSFSQIKGCEASMDVEEFSYGHMGELPFRSGLAILKITIPYTPIVLLFGITRLDFKGLVKEETRSKPITWKGNNGSFQVGNFFEYENGLRIGITNSLLRLQRCQILYEQKLAAPTRATSLLSQVQTELDEDALMLLGFLSRRPLPWYELSAQFVPNQAEHHDRIVSLTKRRTVFVSEPLNKPGFIATQNNLSKRVFEKVLAKYRNSSFKEVLRTAIGFHIAAHQADFLQAKAVSLYSGTEALVNGLTKDSNSRFSPSIFSGLRKHLETTIDSFFQGKSADLDEIAALKGQLGDLNRKHLVNRVNFLCHKFKVPIDQLWPTHKPPVDGLRDIFSRRRADLLHRGVIQDRELLWRDIDRMNALLELFVLRLLDFPLDKIDSRAHSAVRDLVRFESISKSP